MCSRQPPACMACMMVPNRAAASRCLVARGFVFSFGSAPLIPSVRLNPDLSSKDNSFDMPYASGPDFVEPLRSLCMPISGQVIFRNFVDQSYAVG